MCASTSIHQSNPGAQGNKKRKYVSSCTLPINLKNNLNRPAVLPCLAPFPQHSDGVPFRHTFYPLFRLVIVAIPPHRASPLFQLRLCTVPSRGFSRCAPLLSPFHNNIWKRAAPPRGHPKSGLCTAARHFLLPPPFRDVGILFRFPSAIPPIYDAIRLAKY